MDTTKNTPEGVWPRLKEAGVTLVEAGKQWSEDNSSTLAAALAYYAIFSIVPLLIIISTIVAFFYGQDAAQDNIQRMLHRYFGASTSTMIEGALQRASKSSDQGIIASVISAIVMIFGASKVFAQLQDALNAIWNVEVEKEEGAAAALAFVKDRMLSFSMVLGLAFLLLVSLVLSTSIEALSAHMSTLLPGMDALWQLANVGVSLIVYTVLFAMLFKFVPDVELSWRGVWFGAIVTSLLFLAGQWGLSMYLAKNSTVSTYGAAGSLVSFIIWIYYSAQVAFYGAELTQVSAARRGWDVKPSPHATWGDNAYLSTESQAMSAPTNIAQEPKKQQQQTTNDDIIPKGTRQISTQRKTRGTLQNTKCSPLRHDTARAI